MQLRTGRVLEVAPYPAFAWRWFAVQQYHVRAEQDINKLLDAACFWSPDLLSYSL